MKPTPWKFLIACTSALAAFLAAGPARAELQLAPAWQFHADLGGRFVSNSDLTGYTDASVPGSNVWFEGGVYTGYRWGGFGLEGGVDFGPARRYHVDLDPVTSADIDWDLVSFLLSGTYSFGTAAWTHPFINTFGLSLGYGVLSGRVALFDSSNGASGAYSQSAEGFFFPEIFYRGEQFVSPNLAFQFQIGYRFAQFTPVTNYNPTGDVTSVDSPATNADGSNLAINDSGFSLGVGVTFWFQKPWTGGQATGLRATQPVPGVPAATPGASDHDASRRQADFGRTFLDQGRLQDAESAFDLAAQADPSNLDAWKGLGKTYALEGKNADALRVYNRVLESDPNDEEARRYVEDHR